MSETCTAYVCGTGGWTGPLPGDPDSGNVTLSASAYLGGIIVRWSYPLVNPHAVAHVQVYRGNTDSFDSAIQIAIESGNKYFDEQNNQQRWYYWIKVVSTNGTVGPLIGPASAVARKLSDDLIENLTGEIDRGLLAETLQQELDLIPFLQNKLLSEIMDRETGEVSLAQAIQDANDGVAQAMTFIGEVQRSSVSADEAMAETLRATAAVLQNGITAVTEEVQVSVSRLENEITAEAVARQQVVTQLDDKFSGITSQQATQITQVNGRITTEISNRQQAITNVGNRITGVETNMGVIADEVDDLYNAIWTVRLQSGDLIGGFGLLNNGKIIEAGFDVDRFWIGRAGMKVKPFIVDGGIVYIDTARIRQASIDTLHVAGGAITVTAFQQTGSMLVPVGGIITTATVGVNMGNLPIPPGNGVMVQANVWMNAPANSNASAYGRIYRNRDGAQIGFVAISILNGYNLSTSFFGWDPSPTTGVNSYSVRIENPSGGPGGNVQVTVNSTNVVAQGAKR